MIAIGSGAHRQVDDFELFRYACSLVAMNGGPRKPKMTRDAEVAAAPLPITVDAVRSLVNLHSQSRHALVL
ncbi:hypothetical protein V5E97_09650 [Singulisphaera sp. Ch08]|uniref:Uncharacterized protein n=1 Tax=Singulisphaera sp. Ch08 TaxID=3120278 RepID=A0AAU7CMB0_9BACT